MADLEALYRRRFGKDVAFRKKMYSILCKDFYQRYVPKSSVVLDVAAGYCEFINNIKAKKKLALDMNSDVKRFAAKDVEVILSQSSDMRTIKSGTIDVVHISNFFEHITKEDMIKTLKEVFRVLKKGGRLIILQPNIRYCYEDYWMFFDHITPLDDRSLVEALETEGFTVSECRPKFLPYTTKSRLPKSITLLRIYLKLPFLQKLLGKQAFVYCRK